MRGWSWLVPEPFRKLLRLAGTDRQAILELVEAQWMLIRARKARRSQPLGQLVDSWKGGEAEAPATSPPNWRIIASRLSDALDRVATFGLLRPTCLEYAMALQHMLRRRGVETGMIRIGVQIRDGAFIAHAWVQIGDLALGDPSSRVSRFRYLADVKAVQL